MDGLRLELWGIVLDAPDGDAPAAFYQRLLDWEAEHEPPG